MSGSSQYKTLYIVPYLNHTGIVRFHTMQITDPGQKWGQAMDVKPILVFFLNTKLENRKHLLI